MRVAFNQMGADEAALYDRLVSREDAQGKLFAALMDLAPLADQTVLDVGAGTGRMTRLLLTLMAERVIALEPNPALLHLAAATLEMTGMENYALLAGDGRAVPLASGAVDALVIAWSMGELLAGDVEPAALLREWERILRPGGALIVLEALGINTRTPQALPDALAPFYRWLQAERGFSRRWLRTDYHFASLEEADELLRPFHGDALADAVASNKQPIVPACTGIWWRLLTQ